MRWLAAMLLSLSVTTPAFAQQTFVISEADCRLLSRHVPEPSVEFQPGVDVRGRDVVSADLGGRTPIKAPETFGIDIDVFLAERLGIPPDRKLYAPEANVAEVRVEGEKVYFDGQLISSPHQQEIADACRKKLEPIRPKARPK